MAVPEGVPSPAQQKAVIKDLAKETMKLGEKWHLICAKFVHTHTPICDTRPYAINNCDAFREIRRETEIIPRKL
eukprot:1153355-Pyramimonas_sp.AAC.1